MDFPRHRARVFQHVPIAIRRRLELCGTFRHLLLHGLHRDVQRRLALGGNAHFQERAPTPLPQHDILEYDPCRMLEKAPPLGIVDSVHRLRPEESHQQMIQRHHLSGRDQHARIAIEGQEGKRTEDMEMSFDPAAGQMHEHGRPQHLRHRNDVPGDRRARPQEYQGHRQQIDDESTEDRDLDVQVQRAGAPRPGIGRDCQRQDDGSSPLNHEQPEKNPIGLDVDAFQVLAENFLRAPGDGSGIHPLAGAGAVAEAGAGAAGAGSKRGADASSEQPNTAWRRGSCDARSTAARSWSRPVFAPA